MKGRTVTLAKAIKGAKLPKEETEPLWKGPQVDGITQSMLGNYLVCLERFRISNVLGLVPADTFRKEIEYGQMWHLCEEELAKTGEYTFAPLKKHVQRLLKQYPLSQEEIIKWYHICMRQFPIYVQYWKKHEDVQERKPILQEEKFKLPYELPDGRIVYLRGKMDAADLIGKIKDKAVYLQENKTKGQIDEELMRKQLTFDPQCMFYLIALSILMQKDKRFPKNAKLRGVRYNVVRRPLAGGKGTIRQHKPTKKNPEGESLEEYMDRLEAYITEEPEHYFMRWKVEITQTDLQKFKDEFLTPVLVNMCDWYDHAAACMRNRTDPFKPTEYGQYIHWRYPYGVYNWVSQGAMNDTDEYLLSGSTVNLERRDHLFSELQEHDDENV